MKGFPNMFLTDDGTMDTVFECGACHDTLRYDSLAFERADDGTLANQDDVIASVASEHECTDCIDTEYYSKWEE